MLGWGGGIGIACGEMDRTWWIGGWLDVSKDGDGVGACVCGSNALEHFATPASATVSSLSFLPPLEYSALREAWGALSHEVVFLADRLLPLARVVGETGRVQFKRHIMRAGLRWASGSSAALPFSRCLLVPLADAVPQLLAPWLRQQEPHLRLEDARVTARAWIVPPRVGAGQYLSSMKCFCQHTLGNATRSTPESSVAAGKFYPTP